MHQLASLLRMAGAAQRVHIQLNTAHGIDPLVIEIDAGDQLVEIPTLCASDYDVMIDGQDICCVDDTSHATTVAVATAQERGVGALAMARVRSDTGAATGHVILANDAPRRWTTHDQELLRHGSGLATAIADAMTREISERRVRSMSVSLEESQLRLARIVDSAMDAIISTDEARNIVVFNSAAERIFRVMAADVIGTSIDRFLPPTLHGGPDQPVALFAATGSNTHGVVPDGPLQAQRSDGEPFPIEATISRTLVNGSALLTVILRDVTEREKLEAQFRQSQKMEAMGRLAGGVAHDFNNLLTVISGGADFLLHELDKGDSRREDVEEILAASDRAAGLTRQLLAFSRKQHMETRVLDLNVVIRGVERLLRRIGGENITVQLLLDRGTPQVLADAGQLEQVLMNLAVNAADAMPNGGSLRFTTAVCESAALPASFPAWRHVTPDRVVLFSVRDTGSGMSDAVKARVFEPFFTTKDPGRGTGLGLSTVYGIIEQFGGLLAIDSVLGEGTTISIALPLTGGAVVPAVHASSPAPHNVAQGTILLVEDDDAVRAIVHRVLHKAGYQLLEARDAHEGQALWAQHQGASGGIDLVVTDMSMPGENGREFAVRLRRERADLPVLFTSGFLKEKELDQNNESAPTYYLEKPFTSRRLLDEVHALLLVYSR